MKYLPFIRLLLLRYLFTRKRSGLNFLGVIVGMSLSIAPFVVVQQIVDGMIQGIARRFLETATTHLRAWTYIPHAEQQDIVEDIARLEGVQYVSRELQGYGLLSSSTARSAVTLRAIPSDKWEGDAGFRQYYHIDAGSFTLEEPRSIIISRELARILEAEEGDSVRLATSNMDHNYRPLPRLSNFRVSGIVSNGYQELDRFWAYISLEDGDRILGDAEEFIGIKIEHPFSIPNPLFSRILPTPRDRRQQEQTAVLIDKIHLLLPQHWQLRDWYMLEVQRYRSFRNTRVLLLFLMCIIIVVAVMTITSSLLRLVLEQQRDLVILRCMGCSPRLIQHFLVSCGIVIGCISAILGFSLGICLAMNINEIIIFLEWCINIVVHLNESLFVGEGLNVSLLNDSFYLERIPVSPQFFHVYYIVVLVILLSAFSAYIPARRALALRPYEILFQINYLP